LNKSETKGHYDLAPNAEKRMLYLAGDCLSMDNFRHQQNRFKQRLTHPGNAQFMHNIMRAMNSVREGVGDLHVHMHQLTVIYAFFYPAFLQTCQAVLHWKRIQLNPLKRYQNSKALVKIVWEEMERLRLETWSDKMKIDDDMDGEALQVQYHCTYKNSATDRIYPMGFHYTQSQFVSIPGEFTFTPVIEL
jgi:hypothetical protein